MMLTILVISYEESRFFKIKSIIEAQIFDSKLIFINSIQDTDFKNKIDNHDIIIIDIDIDIYKDLVKYGVLQILNIEDKPFILLLYNNDQDIQIIIKELEFGINSVLKWPFESFEFISIIKTLLRIKNNQTLLDNKNKILVDQIKNKKDELDKLNSTLQKRNKELNCLYCISNIIEKDKNSIDQTLQKIVNCIPEALRFPEIVCARIIVEKWEYQTLNYTPTKWFYSKEIYSFGKQIGKIEIYYIKNFLVNAQSIFEVEEIVLFEAIAKRVGKLIERHKANINLKKSELKYRTIFDRANDAILIHDFDGNIIDSNKMAQTLLNYSNESLTKINIKEIILDIKHISLINNDKNPFEARFNTKNGETISIEANTAQIEYNDNPAILIVARDITARQLAQKEKAVLRQQLKQAQKMEAIGTLAGGIAHDLNNILFPISGFTQMTIENLPEKSSERKNLNMVLKAVERAKQLIQQILTFSRQVIGEKKPLYPQIIIKEALKLLRASIPSTIKIKSSIANTKPIMADATQIHQVIINLCTNAYHAMYDQGGIIEIKLSEIEIQEFLDYKNIKIPPDRYVELVVKDNGHGMDESTVEMIFDPYFTTKDIGKGTGIGLSVVHGIITSYNGYITVDSQLDKGSTFKVYIPVLTKNETLKHKKTNSFNIKGNGESIMLVDDEQMIVNFEKSFLENIGFNTTVCSSSKKALEIFRSAPDQFDLIILDMTMPEMNGAQLSKEMLAIKNIPIILWTGYSELIKEEDAKAIGIREFIFKPVENEILASTIRRVLDEEKQKIS